MVGVVGKDIKPWNGLVRKKMKKKPASVSSIVGEIFGHLKKNENKINILPRINKAEVKSGSFLNYTN